jgi:NADH:ubiquinone oxidoreductase subunit 5 (subunit L)/multisubunit Na+/H+ antiporter MnhA subunit
LVYTFELSTRPLSLVIAYVVLVVRALVHCYSLWYLAGDPHQSRFFGLISLFTGFILVLVHAGNSAVIFLG